MHAILALLLIGDVDWTAYGRDAGGTRYSPLAQVTRQNVTQLKPAWGYHTGALAFLSPSSLIKSAFEATPIMIDGTLYLSPTPFNQVIALDPATGKERWKYDPDIDRDARLLGGHIARRFHLARFGRARRATPASAALFSAPSISSARLIPAVDAVVDR